MNIPTKKYGKDKQIIFKTPEDNAQGKNFSAQGRADSFSGQKKTAEKISRQALAGIQDIKKTIKAVFAV